MGKYVFTYNAQYTEYNGNEVREEVIRFFDSNGAINIKQCLDTTFVFDSNGKTTDQWYRLIRTQLDGDGNVLGGGFYLLNSVFYSQQNGHEIKSKCNCDLQSFVEDILGDK
jgi:hypothetical protein